VVVYVVLPAMLCLVLVGEASIVACADSCQTKCSIVNRKSAYQLQQVSLRLSSRYCVARRGGTCDEFEGLGDITAELFGIWRLNVGHVDVVLRYT